MYCVNLYNNKETDNNNFLRIFSQTIFLDLKDAIEFTINEILNLNKKSSIFYIDTIDIPYDMNEHIGVNLFSAEYYGYFHCKGLLRKYFFSVQNCTDMQEIEFDTIEGIKKCLSQLIYCYFPE